MPIFAEFPLDNSGRIQAALPFFLNNNLGPELDFNAPHSLAMSREDHAALAGVWQEHNLSCAVHLPFAVLDLDCPSRPDGPAMRQRLFAAVEAAKPYAPVHYIGHPNLPPARSADELEPYLELWRELAAACAPGRLYLENILEPNPAALLEFMRMLAAENAGLCFDIGHWHAFSGGALKQDLARWVRTLAPYLRHLHLHDNFGLADDHLALGQGLIPLAELPPLLGELPSPPSVTFEAHGRCEPLQVSLDYLETHPDFRAALALD